MTWCSLHEYAWISGKKVWRAVVDCAGVIARVNGQVTMVESASKEPGAATTEYPEGTATAWFL